MDRDLESLLKRAFDYGAMYESTLNEEYSFNEFIKDVESQQLINTQNKQTSMTKLKAHKSSRATQERINKMLEPGFIKPLSFVSVFSTIDDNNNSEYMTICSGILKSINTKSETITFVTCSLTSVYSDGVVVMTKMYKNHMINTGSITNIIASNLKHDGLSIKHRKAKSVDNEAIRRNVHKINL